MSSSVTICAIICTTWVTLSFIHETALYSSTRRLIRASVKGMTNLSCIYFPSAFAFAIMLMPSSMRYWNKSMMGLSRKVSMETFMILFILTTWGLMTAASVSSETPQMPMTSLMRSTMSSIWLSGKKPSSRLLGGGIGASSLAPSVPSALSAGIGFAPHMKPQNGAAPWIASSWIWGTGRSSARSSSTFSTLRIHVAPFWKWIRSYLTFALPLQTMPESPSVSVTKRSTFEPAMPSLTVLFSTRILK
mmetsp:Transcript_62757/g.183557  ORF Transcript_62757/g.183557 Transcript_62757/m.183557 type:complete len:247 (+) Transcript_62757:262-1002(+)